MEITNELAAILVIAIGVAFIIEILKHTKINDRLSTDLIHILTLVLGLIGGLIAMYITGGLFAMYVVIGLTGAVLSSGIYEFIKSLFGGKFTKKVGE